MTPSDYFLDKQFKYDKLLYFTDLTEKQVLLNI